MFWCIYKDFTNFVTIDSLNILDFWYFWVRDDKLQIAGDDDSKLM